MDGSNGEDQDLQRKNCVIHYDCIAEWCWL